MTEDINELELASVRLALAAALAEKGEDYVYVMPKVEVYDDADDQFIWDTAVECQYVETVFDENGTPTGLAASCIWGHALVTLGVDIDELHRREGTGMRALSVPWTDSRITGAAYVAQRKQDMGATWGEAVEAFEARLAELERDS